MKTLKYRINTFCDSLFKPSIGGLLRGRKTLYFNTENFTGRKTL